MPSARLRLLLATALAIAGACTDQLPECRLSDRAAASRDVGSLVDEIRSISGAFAAAVARMPDEPHAAKAPAADRRLPFADRARYYCEAVLIEQATSDGALTRRGLADRLAPGDRHLLMWLGIPPDRPASETTQSGSTARPPGAGRHSGGD